MFKLNCWPTPKHFQFFKCLPGLGSGAELSNETVIAVPINPNNPNAEQNLQLAREAARVIGRQVIVVKAGAISEFDTAFQTIVQQRVGALADCWRPFL